MTAARTLVKFGGGCGAIEAGRDEMLVKIGERRDCCVSQARDENVLVLVLSDWQVLGAR